jgi:hypothetical protein
MNSTHTKINIFDCCVYGNETRFKELSGIDYDHFNSFYDLCKLNTDKLDLSNIGCDQNNDGSVSFTIQKLGLIEIEKPAKGARSRMSIINRKNSITVNIDIKKE